MACEKTLEIVEFPGYGCAAECQLDEGTYGTHELPNIFGA